MLIFRYPVSKCKISKYLDISRYLLGHFSIAYSSHCTVQFSSFLCWVQSFDSDKSYSMMFSLQVQIDTSISCWLMCFCLVFSILNWRHWASFSMIKDFFSSMISFACMRSWKGFVLHWLKFFPYSLTIDNLWKGKSALSIISCYSFP